VSRGKRVCRTMFKSHLFYGTRDYAVSYIQLHHLFPHLQTPRRTPCRGTAPRHASCACIPGADRIIWYGLVSGGNPSSETNDSGRVAAIIYWLRDAKCVRLLNHHGVVKNLAFAQRQLRSPNSWSPGGPSICFAPSAHTPEPGPENSPP
jgi:hypothetical protein